MRFLWPKAEQIQTGISGTRIKMDVERAHIYGDKYKLICMSPGLNKQDINKSLEIPLKISILKLKVTQIPYKGFIELNLFC